MVPPLIQRPFKSFVSWIISRSQLQDIISQNYSDRSIDIPLEPCVNKLPSMLNNWKQIKIITLYSVNMWMGSTEEGYPAASQLQFIMQIMVIDWRIEDYNYLFVELISNIDQRNIIYKTRSNKFDTIRKLPIIGYRSYAEDPSVFLKMIQVSNEERKSLKEMMMMDRIFLMPSSCCTTGETGEKGRIMQHYFNRQYFFRYFMYKNIHWELTGELEVYEGWLKCEKWLKHANQQKIQHEYYCLHRGQFPFFSDMMMIEPYDEGNSFRIFSDSDDCDNICRIKPRKIAKIYHFRHFKGIGTNIEVFCEERIFRMDTKECGSFYLEMIKVDYAGRYEGIIFVTRNPHLFIDIIQTGQRKEIASFIIKHEGLSPGGKNNYSLQAQCAQALVKCILDTRGECWSVATLRKEINALNWPYSLKRQVIDECERSLIIRSWKRAVEDVAVHYGIIDTFIMPDQCLGLF